MIIFGRGWRLAKKTVTVPPLLVTGRRIMFEARKKGEHGIGSIFYTSKGKTK